MSSTMQSLETKLLGPGINFTELRKELEEFDKVSAIIATLAENDWVAFQLQANKEGCGAAYRAYMLRQDDRTRYLNRLRQHLRERGPLSKRLPALPPWSRDETEELEEQIALLKQDREILEHVKTAIQARNQRFLDHKARYDILATELRRVADRLKAGDAEINAKIAEGLELAEEIRDGGWDIQVRDGFEAGIMDPIRRLQEERATLFSEQDRICAGMNECVRLCKQELEGLIPQ